MRLIDLTGQRFGRWLIVERGSSLGHRVRWLCRCDCGNTGLITSHNLKSGRSRSCGCLRTDTITTHGLSKSPEFKTWTAMKARCYTKSNIGYPYYGGRGITVCDRWLHSFETFLADMGKKPDPDYSLDRIDSNGNYNPDNCRWAVRETQDNNRRSNHPLTFRGKTQTITQWAKEVGIPKTTILNRLNWGWPVEDALSWPSEHGRINPHNIRPTPPQASLLSPDP
jgi:hypothetical protein